LERCASRANRAPRLWNPELSANRTQLFRHTFRAMGCPCELQLYAVADAEARRAISAVLADVERLEQRYSRYREDSLLSSINRVAAAGGSIAVDAETAGLLNYAATCFRQSDGLFDITSGVLRRAWNFASGCLPDAARINDLLATVGWDKVRWELPVLSFPVPGMELDFGGVVKEYAADRATSICRELGTRAGMINLGGDISVVGPRPDGDSRHIGLQHPRSHGDVMRTLGLYNGALASSGDYERCIVVDGVRYGHILDPRSGWPVRHLAAVSVVAEFCVVAGSASTIAMLKDESGPAWLAQLGLWHVRVDVTGRAGGSL
jgi:thiamine biosynthesis lipoprotein